MRFVSIGLAILLAGLLAGCGRTEAPAAPAAPDVRADGLSMVTLPPDSPQLKQIRVETVQLADMPTGELVAPARVIPKPNRISRLLPQVHGQVKRVMAQLGDKWDQE